MKIAFFEVQPWEKRYLQKRLKKHSLQFREEPLGPENLQSVESSDVISVFVYSKIDKTVLQKLPKLKFIALRATGFDNIDTKECQKRDVLVCNVPYYGENTVAEHTFGLILSLSRNIHKAYVRTIREDYSVKGLEGFDLKGKTLGVVGAGHIGLNVIKIARAFGMKVVAFDVNQNPFVAEILEYEYLPLKELLAKADIIALHVPYNKGTHHLINKDNIGLIKKGALLINTSRGGVVQTEALIEALDRKILAGVGLDVIEGERLIKEEKQLLYDQDRIKELGALVRGHILLSKENVVFTPHIAFYSREALERILDATSRNINSFVSGKPQTAVCF